MAKDLTVFFVKPHIIYKSEEILRYLKEHIENPNDFHVSFRGIFTNTPYKFWKEFYSHMETNYPKELDKMAREF